MYKAAAASQSSSRCGCSDLKTACVLQERARTNEAFVNRFGSFESCVIISQAGMQTIMRLFPFLSGWPLTSDLQAKVTWLMLTLPLRENEQIRRKGTSWEGEREWPDESQALASSPARLHVWVWAHVWKENDSRVCVCLSTTCVFKGNVHNCASIPST